MTFFAGIDYSTRRIDVVLWPEGSGPRHLPFELPILPTAFDRTHYVRQVLPARGWWRDEGVVAVGLEEPRGPGNGSLMRVQGAILACLPTDLLVHPLAPNEWRHAVGLPGNSGKDAVREWSLRHCGDPGWPQDGHDAHALAWAVRSLVEVEEAA